MVIIRNFTNYPPLLNYMKGILQDNIEYRKSIRVRFYFILFQSLT